MRIVDEQRVDADTGEATDWTVRGTPPACAPINTPQTPASVHNAKGAAEQAGFGRPRSPGRVSGRPDHEDPSRRRPAMPSDPASHAPGQRHDTTAFTLILDDIRMRRSGLGRPRTRSARVLGDKTYSFKANRAYLRDRGIKATIPEKDDQTAGRRRKGSSGGRPPVLAQRSTSSVIPPNECSTSSNSSGQSPRGTTKATTSTTAPSKSPQSKFDSETSHHDLPDTP